MILHHVVVFTAFCFVTVISQTTTTTQAATPLAPTTTLEIDLGCVESSTSEVSGNYTKIKYCNGHSIFLQQVAVGEAHVIFWDNVMQDEMYEAWGFYRCPSSSTYERETNEMSCQSPATIQDCTGTPAIYCPCLSDEDVAQMGDGLGMSDSNINWIEKENFYDCTNWFEWDESTADDSSATMSFDDNNYCESDGDTTPNTVPPGGNNGLGSDTNTKPKLTSSDYGILITVGICALICIAAISYFVWQYQEKKRLKQTQSVNVNLNDEKEEKKQSSILGTDNNNNNPADTNIDITDKKASASTGGSGSTYKFNPDINDVKPLD